jgi:hypothetical protein
MRPVVPKSVHKVSMETGLTRLTKARVESLRPGPRQRDMSDPERRGLVLRMGTFDRGRVIIGAR